MFINFSNNIHIEFGLTKFAQIVLKKGTLFQSQNLILDFGREIQEFEQENTCK
jgi:hypothetical protein